MKSSIKTACLSLLFITSIQAQAAIGSEGWFYTAYYLSDGPVSAHLVGPYGSETQCITIRTADFDGADNRIPWAGGPGCHYIYENEIELANDLYEFDRPYIPVIMAEKNPSEISQFLQNVKDLEEAYNMKQFKQDLRQLIQQTVDQ